MEVENKRLLFWLFTVPLEFLTAKKARQHMPPKMAQTVDAIFVHVLNLATRIEEGQDNINEAHERDNIRLRLEQAEEMFNYHEFDAEDWKSIKYALAVWTDELLIQASGRGWKRSGAWGANPLEMEWFGSNTGGQCYYSQATLARQNGKLNVLEVYYLGVILGFQGFYGNSQQNPADIAASLSLPPTREQWAADASKLVAPTSVMSFSDELRSFEKCEPLIHHRQFLATLLLAVIIGCFAVATFWDHRQAQATKESTAQQAELP